MIDAVEESWRRSVIDEAEKVRLLSDQNLAVRVYAAINGVTPEELLIDVTERETQTPVSFHKFLLNLQAADALIEAMITERVQELSSGN